MDPEVGFWPCGLVEAWGTEAKTPNMVKENHGFGIATEGGKANKKRFYKKRVFCLALVPQAFEKPLGRKTTAWPLFCGFAIWHAHKTCSFWGASGLSRLGLWRARGFGAGSLGPAFGPPTSAFRPNRPEPKPPKIASHVPRKSRRQAK